MYTRNGGNSIIPQALIMGMYMHVYATPIIMFYLSIVCYSIFSIGVEIDLISECPLSNVSLHHLYNNK